MFKNIKLKKALIGAGLGVLGVGTILGTTWSINHFISQRQNVDTGFDADDVNHDYGETVDLPQNIIFKRNVAGQAATLNVKATVLPDTVVNKKLIWELVWTDGGSHGNIADYVTVAPSVDTLSAVITLKAGFNNQIKLVVKSQQDNSKQANCTLDYQKRIVGVNEGELEAGCDFGYWDNGWSGNGSECICADLCDDYTFDDLINQDKLNQLYMLKFDSNAFEVVGTVGNPSLDVKVQFVFDTAYKNAIYSMSQPVQNRDWDNSLWYNLSEYNFDSSKLSGSINFEDFEYKTTGMQGSQGLYGFCSGSCTVNVKFTGADGFEHTSSCTFTDGSFPSLASVSSVSISNSSYTF